ncbi:MAG: transglutaminase [Rhodocyclaceae bacterium]|nr:transglutaminase [Rhodocyclaceae bacterium]
MIPHCPCRDNSVGVARRSPGALSRLWLALGLLWLSPALATDFERLLATLGQKFGVNPNQIFYDWKRLIEDGKALSATDKLRRVNEFINRRIQFGEDSQVWGQTDYWATPMETLGKGAGDCEDFTIAKYFTLLNLGVPNEQLRLVYVKARIGGPSSTVQQAHMVLAYYPSPNAEPQILDNLITDIRPASRRTDLQPVFSFNSQGIWQGAGGSDTQGPGGPGRLSRWAELLQRARTEGFD